MEEQERSRTINLFGALALAVADRLRSTAEDEAGHAAASPAAIVQIGTNPNESIDTLRRIIGLSHSATVRIVERLEADGLIQKKRGEDGRVALLNLTAAGRKVMVKILHSREGLLTNALQGLDNRDWGELTRIIEKIMPQIISSRFESDHVCRLCDQKICPQDRCPAMPPGGFQDG